MDGGPWWPTVYGVIKSRTQLSDFTFTIDSFEFFFFSFLFSLPSVVVDFIGTMKSNKAFELFFFFFFPQSHFFIVVIKPLPLCWAFEDLDSYFFSLSLFFNF